MTLVKWNPARNFFNINSDLMDQFFNTNWLNNRSESDWVPAVDIEEDDNGYKFFVELPGMEKDDVKISLHDDILTIKGEKKFEKKDESKNYHCYERSYGTFERAFKLNSEVIIDKIDATFKNGVLQVSLPKAEIAKPKEIEVKVK
ncbi:MAG: Hsp20/alpha crystallin family protein [Calditrichia bacterium]|nr:Hsp20/alpha crystallin family protein [Calditrichia bacterium]